MRKMVDAGLYLIIHVLSFQRRVIVQRFTYQSRRYKNSTSLLLPGNFNKLRLTLGFLLCWLTNIYWSSRSLLSCSPGWPNKYQPHIVTSTSVILLGFCSRLTDHGIPAQQKALTLCVMWPATSNLTTIRVHKNDRWSNYSANRSQLYQI